MTETNIYNFALHEMINNSQEACSFVCSPEEKKHTTAKKTVYVKCTVYRSLLYTLFKFEYFSFVGANEGQAKTFCRQITGQQLWLAQINS